MGSERRHGFIAFIDESGQEGGQHNPLSSDFFVLSAIVCRTTRGHHPITDAFAAAAKEAGKGPGYRLKKFSKNSQRNHAFLYVKHLGLARCKVATVICHKESFEKEEMLTKNGDLYFFASQMLLERISWICRDAHRRDRSGNGKVVMVFSQRNTLDYQRFQRYAAKIKAGEGAYPSNAAWDHIDLRAITSRPHSSNYDGLLAADYVASSFGAALERNLYGASDEHFVRELRRIIYRPKGGSPWTNGLKVFPPQAETLPETHPRMRWIQSFFDYRKRARA